MILWDTTGDTMIQYGDTTGPMTDPIYDWSNENSSSSWSLFGQESNLHFFFSDVHGFSKGMVDNPRG